MYTAYRINKKISVVGSRKEERDIITLCKEEGGNCYIDKKNRNWKYV